MKRTKAVVEKAISALLTPHGFSKKGAVWTLKSENALLGVWLQGSRFSKGAAYLNFMAWYPQIASKEHGSFPAGDFHLSFRGDVDKRDEIAAELQSDELEIDIEKYVERLDRLFIHESITLLLAVSSIEMAKEYCRQDDRRMSYSYDLVTSVSP